MPSHRTDDVPGEHGATDAEAGAFYRSAMEALTESGVPFLVGGAYALAWYTGIERHTKDFDVFVRAADVEPALRVLEALGCRIERTFPHWLAKAYRDDRFVDLIYSSGNGVARVDDLWLRHARSGTVFGVDVKLCPAEEIIWSKAFIMERERFDGADVAHILRASGPQLDWRRLLDRFGDHGRVLLAHVVLFGFIYPDDHDAIPRWVIDELLGRLQQPDGRAGRRLCRGALLSRLQYLVDLREWGYEDVRSHDHIHMGADDIELWTSEGEREERRRAEIQSSLLEEGADDGGA